MYRFLLAAMATFGAANAALAYNGHEGDGGGWGRQRCSTEVVSASTAGPVNYHPTYAAIQNTLITIQNFTLRLEDGTTLSVPTSPLAIDLQALSGAGQGIPLNLVNVTLPAGAQLAEIVAQIVPPATGNAELVSTGGATCALKTPKTLNLVTAAPYTLSNDSFLIKVSFSPLDSIEIWTTTTVTQEVCSGGHGNWGDGSCNSTNAATTSAPATTTSPEQCSLVDRRQAIAQILGG
jgi:hypothetical protein